jgi:hypothetical protein
MKSAFVNMYHASMENESTSIIGGKDGKHQLVLGGPIYHGWYDRAQVGMHHTMGDKVVQQNLLEREWELAPTDQEKRMEVAQLACFIFLGYGRALRREEISKIELHGILKHFEEGGAAQQKRVTLYLVGRFKQVEGEQHNFLPVSAVTGSGIRIREWVGRLPEENRVAGISSGFTFRKKDGKLAKAAYFEDPLIVRLEWIQQNTEGIIPKSVNLLEEFGVRRSMRRGATTAALNAGLDGPTIDANNGWRKVEAAKGKMPRYSMRQRYTQVLQDLRHRLMFSLGI